jgi:hypothetical protein
LDEIKKGSVERDFLLENIEKFVPRIAKPILFLAFYLEYRKNEEAVSRGEEYLTKLPGRMDATNSGTQQFAMLLTDFVYARHFKRPRSRSGSLQKPNQMEA